MIKQIKVGSDTHNITATQLPYGVCSTAANTAAKTVTVPVFTLETGATVIVKFTYANSASSPTLNVNSTGAKAIKIYGTTAASTGTTTTGWVAGAVQMFTYDGTNWIRDYWNNTTYSTFKASGENAAPGLVPKPSTTAGSTKFLREDATWAVPLDTKNTAGSTDTSSKIFLIGATSQAANPQTYSHNTAYVGTDGCLYSNSTKVSVDGHTHSYLPLAGGTMTGEITIGQGDGYGIQLGTNGRFNATVGSATDYTVLGMINGNFTLGSSSIPTVLRGGNYITVSNELRFNGGDTTGGSKIVLETNKGQITNSGTSTLFGYTADNVLAVGHSSSSLTMRGKDSRPTYNGYNMALASDIPAAYSLPTATSSTLGGVKIGYTESGKNYPVKLNSSGQMYVNVPWANTTYTFNGAVSTIKDSNLTASRALISNSSGKVAVSAVTSTELGYLDGVTSNVQTQLNTLVEVDTEILAACANLSSSLSNKPNKTDVVKSIATGTANGTISVNINGTSSNVAVKGLGSAAYTASTAYATAAQGTLATNAMPKSGGTFTGAVNMGSNTFTTRKVTFNGGNSWIDDHDGSGHVRFAFSQNSSEYKGQIILTTTGILRPFNKSGEGAVGTKTAFSLGMVSAPWEEVVSKIFRVPAGGVLTTAYTGSGNAVWVASSSSNPTSYSLRSSKALSSSRTIKHDIKPLQDKELQAENLYDINVYQAKYNADIIAEDDCRYLKDMPMFIIEEMNEIYPIAITKPMDDVKSWSWEPAYLIPPMLKLVQDQKKQIDELEKRLQKLEEAK
jgi:hypothetical protein